MRANAVLFVIIALAALPSLVSAQSCSTPGINNECGTNTCANSGFTYAHSACVDSECAPLLYSDTGICNLPHAFGIMVQSVRPTIVSTYDETVTVTDVKLTKHIGTQNFNVPLGTAVTSDNKEFRYTPTQDLTRHNYTFSIRAKDDNNNEQAQSTTKQFFVTANIDKIALASPKFARIRTSPFNLTVVTKAASTCKYNLASDFDYDSAGFSMDATQGVVHKKGGITTSSTVDVFVRCKETTSGVIHSQKFTIKLDNNAPQIRSFVTDPPLIAAQPFTTKLDVETNELTVCRYSETETDFSKMSEFEQSNPNVYEHYTIRNVKTVTDLKDKTSVSFNAVCVDLVGLPTSPATATVTVNTDAPGDITFTKPTQDSYITDKVINAEARSNRNGRCRFYNESQRSSKDNIPLGSASTSHRSGSFPLKEGFNTLYVECQFATADAVQPLVEKSVSFTVDTTKPTKPTVDDDTTNPDPEKWHDNTTLSAKWSATDAESGIRSYNYSIINTSDNKPIQDKNGLIIHNIQTDDDSEKVKSLRLIDGQRYEFHVSAENNAGLWSDVGESDGVTIDITAIPPSCSNNIQDGEETSIDCGGSECAACPIGRTCSLDEDCRSGFCYEDPDDDTRDICTEASCNDDFQNQGESDVDCGGPCGKCDRGAECSFDSECSSNSCVHNLCSSSNACFNGALDGGETDIDCGGICAATRDLYCPEGFACEVDDDCESGRCGPDNLCTGASDLDGDGIPNEQDNCAFAYNPGQEDVDNDGTGDECDSDRDNDEMDDDWELANGLDPTNPNDGEEDADDDGLTNVQEFRLGTDPNNPDSDGDGKKDGDDKNPLTPDGGFSIWRLLLYLLIILILVVAGYFGYEYYKTYKQPKEPKGQTPAQRALPVPPPKPTPRISPKTQELIERERLMRKQQERAKLFKAFEKPGVKSKAPQPSKPVPPKEPTPDHVKPPIPPEKTGATTKKTAPKVKPSDLKNRQQVFKRLRELTEAPPRRSTKGRKQVYSKLKKKTGAPKKTARKKKKV